MDVAMQWRSEQQFTRPTNHPVARYINNLGPKNIKINF
jgi:hypothetical protein